MKWDIFISHATDDKTSVVRPLALRLQDFGLRVWYDEFCLRPGDSLREKTDHAVRNSRHSLVVLSKHYFCKEWTRRELNALSAVCTSNNFIIPIWHQITLKDVRAFSPLLADKIALSTETGIPEVALQIVRLIRKQLPFGQLVSLPSINHNNTDAILTNDTKLGPFRIEKFMSRGGCSSVYAARHVNKKICIKVYDAFPLSSINYENICTEFMHMLTFLSSQRLQRTVSYGFIEFEPKRRHLWIAMELITNELTLRQVIPLINNGNAKNIVMEILCSIRDSHNTYFTTSGGIRIKGVVHGDIKPDNFLVSNDFGSIVLIDFMSPDVQKLISSEESGMYATLAFGTPNYSAPEQSKRGIISTSSDIYSLGMMLHEFDQHGIIIDSHEFQDAHRLMTSADPDKRPDIDSILYIFERSTIKIIDS